MGDNLWTPLWVALQEIGSALDVVADQLEGRDPPPEVLALADAVERAQCVVTELAMDEDTHHAD